MFKMKKNFNLELPSEKTGQSSLKMNQKEKELVSSVAGEKSTEQDIRNSRTICGRSGSPAK